MSGRVIVRVATPGGWPWVLDMTDGVVQFARGAPSPAALSDEPAARVSGNLEADVLGDPFMFRWRSVLLQSIQSADGGFSITTDAEMVAQSEVIKELFMRLGRSLLTLDLTYLLMPLSLAQSRSVMEVYVTSLTPATRYLHAATHVKSPVERMKLVTTGLVVGFVYTFSSWKPLNPVLGETAFHTLPDGTRFYFEQVSHHPPLSAFEVLGPPDAPYHFSGQVDFRMSISSLLRSVTVSAKSFLNVRFPDGTRISSSAPDMVISGILLTPRVYYLSGPVEVHDPANGLTASIRFGKPQTSWGEYLFGTPPASTHDQITGYLWQRKDAAARLGTALSPKELADWATHLRRMSHGRVSRKSRDTGTPMLDGTRMHAVALPKAGPKEPAEPPSVVLLHPAAGPDGAAPSGLAASSAQFVDAYRPVLQHMVHAPAVPGGVSRHFPDYMRAVNSSAERRILHVRKHGVPPRRPWTEACTTPDLTGTEKDGAVCICTFSGGMASFFSCGYHVYWDAVRTPLLRPLQAGEGVLPSDSRYRQDKTMLQLNLLDKALTWKNHIEDVQRTDRTLRNEAGTATH